MSQVRRVSLDVNAQVVAHEVEVRASLADFLREDLLLTGTHLGCEHGICGACTVLLDGEPVRACLVLAVQVSGHAVITVEGLAKQPRGRALAGAFGRNFAAQCGFCTPGFQVSAAALLDGNPNPTETEIRTALSGNLCRCTGYASIVAAVIDAARAER